MAIDDWGSEESTYVVPSMTVGRINFSSTHTPIDLPTLNKILPREELLKIIRNHGRIKDFYEVGAVHKAAIESFVDDIIIYLSKH